MSESREWGTDVVVYDLPPADADVMRATVIAMFEAQEDRGQVEPWRLTDGRLLAEIEQSQVQVTMLQARRLALLAEAERRDATLREAGLTTASWIIDQNTHWARSAREELRLALRCVPRL